MRAPLYVAWSLAALVLAKPPASAQQVSALVNQSTIGINDAVRYTIEIEGADNADLESLNPPEADGLELLQRRPSTQSSISIVGTSMTRTLGFTWLYRPLREGDVRIGAATMNIGGEMYTTQPVQLLVVPQVQGSTGGGLNPYAAPQTSTGSTDVSEAGIYIRAKASTSRAFQNEQVTIDYELYYRRDLQPRNSRLADSWDAEGFWREELDNDSPTRTEVINGIRYNIVRLKRVAVFPTRLGSLTVDPLRISTEVLLPRQGRDPFSVPFFRLQSPLTSVERSSSGVSIESVPLPAGAPAAFSGAVGTFSMQTTMSREEVDVGEPVQLDVSIMGTGNLAMLEEPRFMVPHVFERYDPEIHMSINRDGNLVKGYKRFVYLLVPRSNGRFTIPSVEFAFFDPTTEEYTTLSSTPPDIMVSGRAASGTASGTTNAGFPVDDITPPISDSPWVRPAAPSLHTSPWGYAALAMPLLLYGLLFALRRRTTRLAMDTAYARQQRAHPLARKHLKRARLQLRGDGDPGKFFEELERTVLGFIGNRLNIRELGMTRSQIEETLGESGIPEEARQMVNQLLIACETGRFAPVAPDNEAKEQSLDEASRVIVLLDAAFRDA